MTSMPDYVEFDPDGDVVLLLRNRDSNKGQDKDNTDSEGTSGAEVPADVDGDAQPDGIQMRVSSSHLALASSIFKRLLKGGFAESLSLNSTGTAEVRLPEDNPQALQILLNIIHGHVKKVPRAMGIGMLTHIAILIDKYCLHEVTEIFTDMWFKKLKGDIPGSFAKDLMSWLCVTWVLRKSKAFKDTTKIAMRESEGHLEGTTERDLPIPASILDSLEKARQGALSECCDTIRTIQVAYVQPEMQCTYPNCDAMALGGLIKALTSQGLQPLPRPPFTGLSFKWLASNFKKMSLPTLCGVNGHFRTHYYTEDFENSHSHAECGIKRTIIDRLSLIEQGLQGLELEG
ncbi:hypothetical protein GJ744_009889 [Endocarpon pusillum]|uniref:BTB domain-containing protein n=1 Tax=Endocarpon pusillum TaxID=364733 RepID=A0A8H7AHK0_9EURO|nr:hypothetical protein GJ744_009889 [Endocarpon pusillum]